MLGTSGEEKYAKYHAKCYWILFWTISEIWHLFDNSFHISAKLKYYCVLKDVLCL